MNQILGWLSRHDGDEKDSCNGEANGLFSSEMGAMLGEGSGLKHDSASRLETVLVWRMVEKCEVRFVRDLVLSSLNEE